MRNMRQMTESWAPPILSIFRLVVGFLFMQHGAQKLFGALGGSEAELWSLMGLAGILEFGGGLLILVGFLTRPVAFLLSGQMAVAYFMVHAPQGFWPIQNQGELAALYSFTFLYLVAAGPGPWSIDHLLSRSTPKRQEPAYYESSDRTVATPDRSRRAG